MTIENIKTICAIGAGTMGAGTALSFAIAGYDVRFYARKAMGPTGLEGGLENIDAALLAYQKNNLLREEDVSAIRARIKATTNLKEAAIGADLVIESIAEDLKIKQDLFAELDHLCSPSTIFATNTSGLSPTEIANAISRKDKFVVMHFWNPPHLLPLVEIVPGAHTSQETVDVACALMKKIGKKPVPLHKEAWGFIGNRLQGALLREAFHIVELEIASAPHVDAVVRQSFGRHLSETGIFNGVDLAGLDVQEKSHGDLCNDPGIPLFLQRAVGAGTLGAKTGAGVYVWTAEKLAEIKQRRNSRLFWHLVNDAKSEDGANDLSGPVHQNEPIGSFVSESLSVVIEGRLKDALLREALHIIASGIAGPEEIDAVVRYSLGRRLSETGPLESADLGGLDIFEKILGYLGPDLCNRLDLPTLAKQAFDQTAVRRDARGARPHGQKPAPV